MFQNKREDVNFSVFNIITRINELKSPTKLILYKCKCTFDGKKWIKCAVTKNFDVSAKIQKCIMYVKKLYLEGMLVMYLWKILHDSVIIVMKLWAIDCY